MEAQLAWVATTVATGLAGLGLDGPYLLRLWDAVFRGRTQAAVDAARRQWMVPDLLRPLVAAWWLAHFVGSLSLGYALQSVGDRQNPHLVKGIEFGYSACFGFAANGFLLMSVCALTRSERVRRTVWRFRVVIDLLLAFMGMFARPF
jgi:hypothetical protein